MKLKPCILPAFVFMLMITACGDSSTTQTSLETSNTSIDKNLLHHP